MKKILTAIGNEYLNYELKKEENIEIIFNDIQYKEGIIEILEKNQDLDFIILSIILPGEISIKELIQKIFEVNKKIKIIIIFEEKNEELEKYLYSKGVYKIIYNNEIEINDLIKIINNNSENEDLKEEINKLKNIILEKNKKENKNNILKLKNKINYTIINKINKNNHKKINEKNNKKLNKKIICITGPSGVGKSIISINLAKSTIYSKNKTLIIDFDLLNNSIHTILGLKNNSKINSSNLNDLKINNKEINLIKINKKIDLLIFKDFTNNKININKELINNIKIINNLNIKEIINSFNNYNYIIIDTNSNEFELNKKIIELSNKIIFVSDTNLLEINKSIKLLDKYINTYKINKNNFNIIFNKYNSYSIDLKLLNKIFSEFKIIGYLKYNEKYNKLINKNIKNNFINKKIRKEYLKIINKMI